MFDKQLFTFSKSFEMDNDILSYISKDEVLKSEELECIINKGNRMGLVPVQVTVNGKYGTYQRTQWMSISDAKKMKDGTVEDLSKFADECNIDTSDKDLDKEVIDHSLEYFKNSMDADTLGSYVKGDKKVPVKDIVLSACDDYSDDKEEWQEMAETITGSSEVANKLWKEVNSNTRKRQTAAKNLNTIARHQGRLEEKPIRSILQACCTAEYDVTKDHKYNRIADTKERDKQLVQEIINTAMEENPHLDYYFKDDKVTIYIKH